MKAIIILVVALVLGTFAVLAAPHFPGYVQFAFAGYVVETTIVSTLVAMLLVIISVILSLWLWRAPRRWWRNRRRQRAQKQLQQGLVALEAGQLQRAERALTASARDSDDPGIGLLGAARAAERMNATDRQQEYLDAALARGDSHDPAVLLSARNALHRAQPELALDQLEGLQPALRDSPQAMKIRADALIELARYDELLPLLAPLVVSHRMTQAEADRWRDTVVIAQFEKADKFAAAETVWRGLSKQERLHSTAIIAGFAATTRRLGFDEAGVRAVKSALASQWQSSLAADFGKLRAADEKKQLKQAERWLAQHPDDSGARIGMARLCARRELWGPARNHYIAALSVAPDAEAYAELAEIYQVNGATTAALTCMRNAWRVSQGHAAQLDPLPNEALVAKAATGTDRLAAPINDESPADAEFYGASEPTPLAAAERPADKGA